LCMRLADPYHHHQCGHLKDLSPAASAIVKYSPTTHTRTCTHTNTHTHTAHRTSAATTAHAARAALACPNSRRTRAGRPAAGASSSLIYTSRGPTPPPPPMWPSAEPATCSEDNREIGTRACTHTHAHIQNTPTTGTNNEQNINKAIAVKSHMLAPRNSMAQQLRRIAAQRGVAGKRAHCRQFRFLRRPPNSNSPMHPCAPSGWNAQCGWTADRTEFVTASHAAARNDGGTRSTAAPAQPRRTRRNPTQRHR
jgi:hypothetical protein